MLNEMKEAYLIYSQSQRFIKLLEETREFMKGLLCKYSRPSISYSSGKDSLVLLLLCLEVKPDIPVMWHDSGVELPESYTMIKKAQQLLNLNLHTVMSPVDVLEIYKEKKAYIYIYQKDLAWTEAMMNPICDWLKHQKINLNFIGLRKEESKKRRLMLGSRGKVFYAKTREMTQAYPLADWRGEDVFAYIFMKSADNLIHPAYYKTRFVETPDKIRVSWFCDPAGVTGKKGAVWLKYYYPELFRKLFKIFPEIKSYS